VGVIEKRDFTLSLTDEETLRRPRLPFWHIDYFTQPQLDDPEFFLVPDWPLPADLGPPVDVLGMPDEAAVVLRPARLCPSPPPPPETVEAAVRQSRAHGDSQTSQSHEGSEMSHTQGESRTSQAQGESQTSVDQSSSQQEEQEEDPVGDVDQPDDVSHVTASGSSILPELPSTHSDVLK